MAGRSGSPLLPGLPTIAQAGLPGFELDNWGGILAPAGTPRAVIDRLNGEITRTLRDPQVVQRLAAQGIDAIPSTPEEFGSVLNANLAKWAKVVRDAGIRPE
jgi:tripartite-type tricarboxylate transporter receptor subunit TctC